ncbi:MAG TPA: histidine kinase [Streptosporangiaceae bacterium]
MTWPAKPSYRYVVAMEFTGRVARVAARLSTRVPADVLLAMCFAVAADAEAVVKAGGEPVMLVLAALSGPAVGGPLAIRRARPVLAMTLMTGLAAAASVLQVLIAPGAASQDLVVPILALMVASYSLGAHATAMGLTVGAIEPLLLVVVVDTVPPGSRSVPGALLFFAVFIVAAPVLAGRLVRARHRMIGRLEEQRRQIEAEHAIQTRATLALERLQLAGRLQDTLVAGLNSVIDLVAVARTPGERRQSDAVADIETTSRALLARTREVVVSLTSFHPDDNRMPPDPPAAIGKQPDGQRLADSAALPWLALAAAAVCVGFLIEVTVIRNPQEPLPVAIAGCFVIAVPIAMAWRWPLLMAAAAWAIALLFSSFITPLTVLFTAISLSVLAPFWVAFFKDRVPALTGLAVCCLGELACYGPATALNHAVLLVIAWCGGRVLRARSRLAEELRLNNAWLAEHSESSARQAVLEDRATVARELHDAIGHSLTIIALHAGAARRIWATDREKAGAILATIARIAGEGLGEVRMAVGSRPFVIHHGQAGDGLMARIQSLIADARAAGLSVVGQMDDDGELALGADAELAVFRVVQEALTNVLRHAPASTAQVAVRNAGARIEIIVANSGGERPPPRSGDRTQGLRSMRQRVEACGGRLEAGRRPDGGFQVRAEFPSEVVRA